MKVKKILKKMDDQTEVSITFGGFTFDFGSKFEVDPALGTLKVTKKTRKNDRYIIEACMDGVSIDPFAYVLEDGEDILKCNLWLGVLIRYANEGDVYLDETYFREISKDPITLLKYVDSLRCDAINEFHSHGNDTPISLYSYSEIMREIDRYNSRMLALTSMFDLNSRPKTSYVLGVWMDQYLD